MRARPVDKVFLGTVIALTIVGVFAFFSAALSVFPESQPQFYRMLISQYVLGLGGGYGMLYVFSRIRYTKWQNVSLWLFIIGLVVTALVLIPGLGIEHGGAKRWLSIGPISFQPAEILKVTYVMIAASWLAHIKTKITQARYGLLPFVGSLALIGVLMLLQPDTGTFLVIAATGFSLYFVAGGTWRDIGIVVLVGILGVVGLVLSRDYLRDRIQTFLNPADDPYGSSYQILQSKIALGSGQVTGRGYGQGVQKFNYLPEPAGDSIFAVIGEEFGFVGTFTVLLLYVLFMWRGLMIAKRAPDIFGRLLVVGIVILIGVQSFLNIASIVGVFPLTGLPLIFISHGGTALMASLASVGIVMNVSRYTSSSGNV